MTHSGQKLAHFFVSTKELGLRASGMLDNCIVQYLQVPGLPVEQERVGGNMVSILQQGTRRRVQRWVVGCMAGQLRHPLRASTFVVVE